MKLYRTKAQTGADSWRVNWDGTQADATAMRKIFKAAGLKPETEDVDVPTDKAGLIAWLNENTTGE